MFTFLFLAMALASPSPERYLIDLSLGSWKQVNGNIRLEFLGDGRAEVYSDANIVVPEVARVAPEPEFVLPAPIWKNHRWAWKGVCIREADWEWQLLKDTLQLPAHWLGGKRGEMWTFVQVKAPHFLIPPAPPTQLILENQRAWKKCLPVAVASKKPQKICHCLAQVDFPDKELEPTLKENPMRWKCLQPHARLRFARFLEYSNAQINTLLKN